MPRLRCGALSSCPERGSSGLAGALAGQEGLEAAQAGQRLQVCGAFWALWLQGLPCHALHDDLCRLADDCDCKTLVTGRPPDATLRMLVRGKNGPGVSKAQVRRKMPLLNMTFAAMQMRVSEPYDRALGVAHSPAIVIHSIQGADLAMREGSL